MFTFPPGLDRTLFQQTQEVIAAGQFMYRNPAPAWTGKIDPNTNELYADPCIGLPPGYVWVREGMTLDIANSRAAVAALCKVRNDYAGLPVWVGFDTSTYLVAFDIRADPESAALFGSALPGMSVPQVPTDAQNQYLATRLLDVALVRPSEAGGFLLAVNAYPGAFWQAGQVDASALSSPSAGTVALGIVGHDPADATLYLYGATSVPYAATTLGIDATYFASIVLPYAVYPLAGVAVAAGTTDITKTTLAAWGASIIDLRLHLDANGVNNPGWLVKTPTTIPTGAGMVQPGDVRVAASLTVLGDLYII